MWTYMYMYVDSLAHIKWSDFDIYIVYSINLLGYSLCILLESSYGKNSRAAHFEQNKCQLKWDMNPVIRWPP